MRTTLFLLAAVTVLCTGCRPATAVAQATEQQAAQAGQEAELALADCDYAREQMLSDKSLMEAMGITSTYWRARGLYRWAEGDQVRGHPLPGELPTVPKTAAMELLENGDLAMSQGLWLLAKNNYEAARTEFERASGIYHESWTQEGMDMAANECFYRAWTEQAPP